MNLLKFRDPRIRALVEIDHPRIRMYGPRYETVDSAGNRIPMRIRTGPDKRRRLMAIYQVSSGYTVVRVADGEEREVAGDLARELVLSGLAEIVPPDRPILITEMPDGYHKVEPYSDLSMAKSQGLGTFMMEFERVVALKDGCLGFIEEGTPFRIRKMHIRTPPCYADDPPGDHAMRVMRESPTPKGKARRAQSQAALLADMWQAQNPGQPLPKSLAYTESLPPAEAVELWTPADYGWQTAWRISEVA